jgi:hypoxanthine phosphoribosyltransferase
MGLEDEDLEIRDSEDGKSEPQVTFVHPSEEQLAQILDFYQLPWQYEPRTFPLQWDEQGNVIEAFRPDFYLPEQDLYIELTTISQRLITKKHRKLRRLKELYPDIKIKLINRYDFKQMMLKFGLEDPEALIGQQAQGNKIKYSQIDSNGHS